MNEKEDKWKADHLSGADYEVGYGKPPKHSRFRPGESGNPKGRPKGSKNKAQSPLAERMKDIIIDEAYRGISVRDGDRTVTVPMAQAVIRSMSLKAAKGDHRSQRLFAELLSSTESANRLLQEEWFKTALEYKIDWTDELERRKRFGITDLPPPLPHPDHIKLDPRNGTVRITGPMTEEEKVDWDRIVQIRDSFQEECDWLVAEIEKAEEPDLLGVLKKDLELNRRILARANRALGVVEK
ncbi:MAG: hypothetical protein KDK28_02565 [Maritimibacter sp.]|nr:hypothetical protein [Maritimibacter sp.]